MNDKIVIINARVVLPNSVTIGKTVLCEGDRIVDTDYSGSITNYKVIDANGGWLLAGFIDIHSHGGGNADFMDCTPLAFEKAVTAHLAHGTTTIVPTAMSATEDDIISFLSTFKKFKNDSTYSRLTPGVRLEGPYFSGAGGKSAGAQPKNIIRLPKLDEIIRILEKAKGDILIWDAAPEIKGAKTFADTVTRKGIIASMGHTSANSEQATAGINSGFSHCTHFYNAMTTYHKKDQTVLGGVVEAAYLNDNVTVELICDGRHIPKDVLHLALKIKGAHNVIGITDSMRLAATNLKRGKLGSLEKGTDVVVDDAVAKLPDLSSFAGSTATMERCFKVLCKDYGFSPNVASVMLSLAPAEKLGINKSVGSIEQGKLANLVIIDTNYNIKSVILEGKIVNI